MSYIPGKIVCVGRNYAAHARELGNAVPERPLLFLKPPSAVICDGDAIRIPAASRQVEHEGEIGIVIGTRLRQADEVAARAAVRAVVPMNDVTARDLQKTDGQWTRAKGFDTFCPVGTPVAIAPDADLTALEVICRVNGAVRQHGYARDMAFSIPFLLSSISQIMTLEPGDLIATGTPAGVGHFANPPRYLAAGDVMRVEIEGIGALENPVVDEPGRIDDHAAAAGVAELAALAR